MSTGLSCEFCLVEIIEGEPFIRISADPVIQIEGEVTSLVDNEILVFSVYHSGCLMKTFADPTVASNYIEEARIAIATFELCEECQAIMPDIRSAQTSALEPAKETKPRHLSLVPESE